LPSTQPLIVDYTLRPEILNIYSANDPVSGPLDYYDPVPKHRPPTAKPVKNVPDPQSWIPLLAHIQYWTNTVLVRELISAIERHR